MNVSLRRCLQTLWLHRLRSILSTLGVLFGVIAVVAMLAIGEGAKQETLQQIEQLGTRTIIVRQIDLSEEQHLKAREHLSQGLSLADAEAFKKNNPDILLYAPVKVVEANIFANRENISPEILASTPSYQNIKRLKMAEGRFLCDKDISQKSFVCVLGRDVAQKLGKQGHVGKWIRIEHTPFQIVGILAAKSWTQGKTPILKARNLNEAIFIPLGVEQTLPHKNYLKKKILSEIILQANSSQAVENIRKMTKRILEREHHSIEDYQLIIPQELIEQAYQTQRTFNFVLGSIAAISLLVGGIGIMNIMLANVSERTREIGIRRAIGATQSHIVIQFLIETLALTFIGACSGVLLGVSIAIAIGYFAGWPTVVTFWSIFIALTMALGIGLCAGLYPAVKAATMDPIAALRNE